MIAAAHRDAPDGEVATLSDRRCRLGEGATYDPAAGLAFWFDILECRLFEADVASGRVDTHALPVMASALAAIDGERQLVATADGLAIRDVADGTLRLAFPVEADRPGNRSNDARAHPSGTYWFGTMGLGEERGAGAVYALHRGAVTRLFGEITIPNAICFSQDGATGFFADTGTNVLLRVPLDPETGLPAGEPVPAGRHDDADGLDGAVIDSEGLIWVARWGGSRVDVLTQAGDRVRSVPMPARNPTCPAFVGPAFDRLLVTSANPDRDDADDPHGGRTFLLHVGASGRPEPRVRLDAT